MVESRPWTAYQPLKAIFIIGSLLYLLLLRLPFLGLYFIRSANRPDSTWSWTQAIAVATAKFLFNLGSRARFARVWSVEKAPKNKNRVFVPAANRDQLSGVLLDSKVKPVDLMGEWYPSPFDGEGDISRNAKVILFMFGGAYVMGDSKPATYAATLKKLCPVINAKFFIFEYRLAGSAGGQPFPAQLQDLFSAYQYLLKLGIACKNIILAGESAGGNGVTALLRYLEDCGPEHQLPLPAAALLSSPWVDMTPDPWLRLKHPKYATDMVVAEIIMWGQQAFIPANRPASDAYISPALQPFRSRVPIWMEGGTGEVIFDKLKSFAQDLKQAGTDVQFYAAPHGTHCPIFAAGSLGFDVGESVGSFTAFLSERGI